MGLPLSLGVSQLSVSPSSIILGASGTLTDVRGTEIQRERMGNDEKGGVVERREGGGINEGE